MALTPCPWPSGSDPRIPDLSSPSQGGFGPHPAAPLNCANNNLSSQISKCLTLPPQGWRWECMSGEISGLIFFWLSQQVGTFVFLEVAGVCCTSSNSSHRGWGWGNSGLSVLLTRPDTSGFHTQSRCLPVPSYLCCPISCRSLYCLLF